MQCFSADKLHNLKVFMVFLFFFKRGMAHLLGVFVPN